MTRTGNVVFRLTKTNAGDRWRWICRIHEYEGISIYRCIAWGDADTEEAVMAAGKVHLAQFHSKETQ